MLKTKESDIDGDPGSDDDDDLEWSSETIGSFVHQDNGAAVPLGADSLPEDTLFMSNTARHWTGNGVIGVLLLLLSLMCIGFYRQYLPQQSFGPVDEHKLQDYSVKETNKSNIPNGPKRDRKEVKEDALGTFGMNQPSTNSSRKFAHDGDDVLSSNPSSNETKHDKQHSASNSAEIKKEKHEAIKRGQKKSTAKAGSCNPIKSAAECKRGGIKLGRMSTAIECAREVIHHQGCSDTFMFSSTVPSWGCRCCVDYQHTITRNKNWAIHSARNCGVTNPTEILEEEIGRMYKELFRLSELSTYESMSEERVSELYGVLREVVETLGREGSKLRDPWFAISGTLLGAFRSRPPGMMRWDDDLDLAVKASSLGEVHSILKQNPRLKWKPHVQFLAYKYGLANNTKAKNYGLDFFGLDKIESKWHFPTPNGKAIEKNFRGTYMTDDELESTHPCRFWDLELQCPSGSLAFLQRTYGKKVLSEARIRNHSGGSFRNIDMKKEDINQHSAYFPAMNRDLLSKLRFDE